MVKRRYRLLFIMGMLLLFLFLNACSQGTSKEAEKKDTEETSSAATEAESKEESDEPKRGGTFTILSGAAPPTLDPFRTSSANTHAYLGLVYSKLVTYETGPDVAFTDYNIIPDLAEEWDVSDDGTVYTFHLRDTTWHDVPPVNGRKFVADDVVATMEQIINLPGHQASHLSEVESVEAVDEKTVVFTLKQPLAPFLNFMADHFMWILPREAVEGEIDLDHTAIGTGPFILEKYEDNIQGTFVRNPNFYEEGKPYLDKVIHSVVPDQGARIASFRTGQAERIAALSPEETESLKKTNPDAIFDELIYGTQGQVYMNMEREPFNDLRVRKAISLAVDRQNAVDSIYGKGVVSSPVNPSMTQWTLPLEEREELQPYDPEKAKELLAEAGYPDGFATKIMTTDAYSEQLVRLAQWVAEDLRAIGINAEIEMTEYATYYSQRWPNLDYDIGIGYQTLFQEADGWLTSQFKTGATKNWYGISDPELDKMLDEQRAMLDEEKRVEMVHDIQRYILQEVVNPIPLVTQYQWWPRQPYVRNWNPHVSYGFINMKDVWLDK